MRIGLLLLGLALAHAGRGQTCADCHREIAASYAQTSMGRSFRAVRTDTVLTEFDGSTFEHTASRQSFTALHREGTYLVRRSQTGAGGNPANLLEVAVDYVIGSGGRARSYLHRTPDNRLVEFPVTWYPENGGHWGMSPAYDRAGHSGFSREIPYRCMFCHNGYPEVNAQDAAWDGATEFPARLPDGIDCERCHGPGANHVQAVKAGRPAEAVRAAIVNPARLSGERQMEVCMQCHLETTSMQLPGAMMRFGRGVFSYRPGEPLSDYMLYFDHAPGTGNDDKFELVSSVYRLSKSACFQKGGGNFTCTSCHDPHRQASPEATLRKTREVCEGCHATTIAKLTSEGRHTKAEDCTGCHMPQRQAEDAVHIRITDHWIRARHHPEQTPLEKHDGNTLPYAGEVTLYYPKELPNTAESALYLAVAQVKQLANLPEGLHRLERLVGASATPARALYELGQALFDTGQAARAAPFYQRAFERQPGEWRYLFGLGRAWQGAGDVEQAVRTFEQARAIAPNDASLLNALAYAYSQQGKTAAAIASFRQVLRRDPGNTAALNNLGNALARTGDTRGAEESIREAVRQRPEAAAVHLNLVEVLLQAGKLGEASEQLTEAIRCGASTDQARSAWSQAMAASGNIADARARYDASQRQQVSAMHEELGNVMVEMRNADGAIAEYRMALAWDAKSASTLVNLALTLSARGQATEAHRLLDEALRLQPDLFAAHLKLGEILIAEGRPELAAIHLKRAAEAPDSQIRNAAKELLSGK